MKCKYAVKYYQPLIYLNGNGDVSYNIEIGVCGFSSVLQFCIVKKDNNKLDIIKYFFDTNVRPKCMRLKELPKVLKEYFSDPLMELEIIREFIKEFQK